MYSPTLSLKALNSFQLDNYAAHIVYASSIDQLCHASQASCERQQPFLVIGEGSNLLFLENFSGTAIVNRLKGITQHESAQAWHLHVGAGENWHELVRYSLSAGYGGLENLAMIPGCVGSAPIQNIGAYGVELKNYCEYVDVLALNTGVTERLTAAECYFGYRDSIFKHQYHDGYVITAVGLILPKDWQPVLEYGELKLLDKMTITPQVIFDEVCRIRRLKLPDPHVTGNAGSFFKNPLVSSEHAQMIKAEFPEVPIYLQPNGSVKLAAGWLIEQCGLKGYRCGGAAVHSSQALVLINTGRATSDDIVQLAKVVRQKVAERFGVWLEPEVRFIAAAGEVDATGVLS
ncbi:MAG: UDP-N-acetylenolpyruvoylglucosamine reductase [Candidatus Erwinia impunctatus]|nr:UDP-N-acetylenolpyruvoylglucosamine reductase [Culicoides impunctatus]